MPAAPVVSVVVPTHERPGRLARALVALRAQSLSGDAYEVVVVDDGSGPATREALRRFEALEGGPALKVLRSSGGPAAARNRGWRAARAPLVAFTDDDCEPTRGWLEGLLEAATANPGAIIQGPVLPNPADADALGTFYRTLSRTELGPWFETANMLYPRGLLERLGGFDEVAFTQAFGEDTDLGWRAMDAGARSVWAPDATVYHAVTPIGPIGILRTARRAEQTTLCFKRHRGLRRERVWGVFWTREHAWMTFAVLACALPRLPLAVRIALAAPYARRLYAGRRTPALAPFRLALDIVEIAACARGALRFRVMVL